MCNLQYTLYTVYNDAIYNIHYTMHNVRNLQYTLYNV